MPVSIDKKHMQTEGVQAIRDGDHVAGIASPAVDDDGCGTVTCTGQEPRPQVWTVRRRDADVDRVRRWLTSPPRRPSENALRDLVGNDCCASHQKHSACDCACDPHHHMMTATPIG